MPELPPGAEGVADQRAQAAFGGLEAREDLVVALGIRAHEHEQHRAVRAYLGASDGDQANARIADLGDKEGCDDFSRLLTEPACVWGLLHGMCLLCCVL